MKLQILPEDHVHAVRGCGEKCVIARAVNRLFGIPVHVSSTEIFEIVSKRFNEDGVEIYDIGHMLAEHNAKDEIDAFDTGDDFTLTEVEITPNPNVKANNPFAS